MPEPSFSSVPREGEEPVRTGGFEGPPPPLVDSHCHLDDERFRGEEEAVLERARTAGLAALVTIGTDEATSSAAAALSARHRGFVYHTVGAHPSDADRLDEGALRRLEELAKTTDPRAVGEVGLDYHHESDRRRQRALFSRMIALARRLGKPLVVHNREADADVHAALAAEAGGMPILLHCYSAGPDWVERFLSLGCLFSFAGPVTFKNGGAHREAARRVPLDRLLVETDAPYLTPHPHRGKRNEPAYVRLTAEAVAAAKGMEYGEVARVTTENARRFFGF